MDDRRTFPAIGEDAPGWWSADPDPCDCRDVLQLRAALAAVLPFLNRGTETWNIARQALIDTARETP